MTKDQITVHIRLPRVAHHKAKLQAVKKGKTIGEIIADALKVL